MVFILGFLAVVAVLASLLLMFVILLQEPKGGGLAAALGGSGMEAIGANAGAVNSFTCWVAGIWIGACLLHAILQPSGVVLGSSLKDGGDKAVVSPPPEKSEPPKDTPK